MQKKIKEIKPNPIITSTVEIRFNSDIKEEDVLGTFYKIFGTTYSKVVDRGIPKQIKITAQEFQNQPDYILSNEEYSISVGRNVIAFENVGNYKLWKNYYQFIIQSLSLLEEQKIIKLINRVGLRYASIFGNNKVEDVLRLNFSINHNDYLQSGDLFRTFLKKNGVQLHLQIIQDVKAQKGNEERKGLYIDIDASQDSNLPVKLSSELFQIIDNLHTEEKILFESLMRKEYLESLDITYE